VSSRDRVTPPRQTEAGQLGKDGGIVCKSSRQNRKYIDIEKACSGIQEGRRQKKKATAEAGQCPVKKA